MLNFIIGLILGLSACGIPFMIYASKNKTIELSDDAPKSNKTSAKAMKLSNELAPYIQEKDGKLYIKVRK